MTQDSKEQQQQANRSTKANGGTGNKKLNGPNRPST